MPVKASRGRIPFLIIGTSLNDFRADLSTAIVEFLDLNVQFSFIMSIVNAMVISRLANFIGANKLRD